MVEAVRYFSPYLYGREFQVFTDHQPLCSLMTFDHLNSRLKRMSAKLQPWMVSFVYLPGKENMFADALSRQDFGEEKSIAEEENVKTKQQSGLSLALGGCGDPTPRK